jgi:Lon protease-like protein
VSRFSVPLFPLNTVLFPGGPLLLRVFEPRYLDMISRCMKEEQSFGVVLLTAGSEVAGTVQTVATGTLASICDWDQGADGLLGIKAIGGQRFRLLSLSRQEDGLNLGDIEILPAEPEMPVPGDYSMISELLRSVLIEMNELYAGIERLYDDASWVGYRFAEILPLEPERKQECLEMDDPLVRLEFLQPYLRHITSTGSGWNG